MKIDSLTVAFVTLNNIHDFKISLSSISGLGELVSEVIVVDSSNNSDIKEYAQN